MAYTDVVALDFETANSERAACSMGIARMVGGELVERREILINPEAPFDFQQLRVHGLTPEMVQNAPTFPAALEELKRSLTPTSLLVAHNAKFDLSVLAKNAERYHLALPSFSYLCTYQLSAMFFAELSRCGLANIAEHLGLTFTHHRADDDAEAALRVFAHIESALAEQNLTVEEYLRREKGYLGFFSQDTHKAFKSGKRAYQLPAPTNPEALAGQQICLAGDLTGPFNNRQMAQLITDRGGEVKKRVSRSLHFFVVGRPNFFTTEEEFAYRIARAKEIAFTSPTLEVVHEKDFVSYLQKHL